MELQPIAQVFSSYGLAGAVIGILFYILLTLHGQHRQDRADWFEAYRDLSRETTEVLRKLEVTISIANERGRKTD